MQYSCLGFEFHIPTITSHLHTYIPTNQTAYWLPRFNSTFPDPFFCIVLSTSQLIIWSKSCAPFIVTGGYQLVTRVKRSLGLVSSRRGRQYYRSICIIFDFSWLVLPTPPSMPMVPHSMYIPITSGVDILILLSSFFIILGAYSITCPIAQRVFDNCIQQGQDFLPHQTRIAL